MNITEEWRIFLFGGRQYKVSSLGRISSVHKILSQFSCRNGYLSVGLWNGKSAPPQYVHRLVALAFIPNPMNKPQVNHKDGSRTNNRSDNLEWMTNGENVQHSYDNLARRPQGIPGVLNHRAKLNDEKIRQIRREYVPHKRGSGTSVLARRYGISTARMIQIVNGKAWSHVK